MRSRKNRRPTPLVFHIAQKYQTRNAIRTGKRLVHVFFGNAIDMRPGQRPLPIDRNFILRVNRFRRMHSIFAEQLSYCLQILRRYTGHQIPIAKTVKHRQSPRSLKTSNTFGFSIPGLWIIWRHAHNPPHRRFCSFCHILWNQTRRQKIPISFVFRTLRFRQNTHGIPPSIVQFHDVTPNSFSPNSVNFAGFCVLCSQSLGSPGQRAVGLQSRHA